MHSPRKALVFSVTLLLYFFSGSGHIDTIDAEPSLDTAKVLWREGRLGITPQSDQTYFSFQTARNQSLRYHYAKGRNGRWFSKMGLVTPLLYLPAAVLADLFWERDTRENAVRFLVSFVNAGLGALLVLVVYWFLCARVSPQTALFYAALLGFGTLIFPYTSSAHREMAQALFLTASLCFLCRAQKPEKDAFLVAGLSLALGILTKQAFLVPALGVIALACFKARLTKPLFFFLTPVITSLGFWAVYSGVVFGSPFTAGYSPAVETFHSVVWRTPFWEGVWLQLFSPHWSVFAFNPVLLVLLALILQGLRQTERRLETGLILSCVLLQVFLHARWYSPIGKEALGPRYTVTILPLFFLCLPRLSVPSRWKPLLLGGALFCVGMQTVLTSVKPNTYWFLTQKSPDPNPPNQIEVAFRLFPQLLKRPSEIDLHTLGFATAQIVDLSPHETLAGVNYWWRLLAEKRSALPRTAETRARLPPSRPATSTF